MTTIFANLIVGATVILWAYLIVSCIAEVISTYRINHPRRIMIILDPEVLEALLKLREKE